MDKQITDRQTNGAKEEFDTCILCTDCLGPAARFDMNMSVARLNVRVMISGVCIDFSRIFLQFKAFATVGHSFRRK